MPPWPGPVPKALTDLITVCIYIACQSSSLPLITQLTLLTCPTLFTPSERISSLTLTSTKASIADLQTMTTKEQRVSGNLRSSDCRRHDGDQSAKTGLRPTLPIELIRYSTLRGDSLSHELTQLAISLSIIVNLCITEDPRQLNLTDSRYRGLMPCGNDARLLNLAQTNRSMRQLALPVLWRKVDLTTVLSIKIYSHFLSTAPNSWQTYGRHIGKLSFDWGSCDLGIPGHDCLCCWHAQRGMDNETKVTAALKGHIETAGEVLTNNCTTEGLVSADEGQF